MSGEAEKIVRRIVDATNRADVEAFVAELSPDVEWEDNLFWTEGGTVFRGRAAVRDWLNRVWEPWEDLQMEIVEVQSASDGTQFAGFDLTARGKESGAKTQARFWSVWRIAEGKISVRKGFRDRDEALEAAGLS
jgi:ketosteroid isomerase-like protein